MKQSLARLLHWFPSMMDWAEGRIPTTWNSQALKPSINLWLTYFKPHWRVHFQSRIWCLPDKAQTAGQMAAPWGCCWKQLQCFQSPKRTPTEWKQLWVKLYKASKYHWGKCFYTQYGHFYVNICNMQFKEHFGSNIYIGWFLSPSLQERTIIFFLSKPYTAQILESVFNAFYWTHFLCHFSWLKINSFLDIYRLISPCAYITGKLQRAWAIKC